MIYENPRWHAKTSLEQPELCELETAWRAWARAEPVPLRERFDPIDFPRLLPWLCLAEISGAAESLDARLRYMGSEIVHYFDGAHLTGTRLSALEPAFRERWMEIARQVAAVRAPCYFEGAPFMVGRAHVDFELLALPLSRSGADVDFIVLGFSRL